MSPALQDRRGYLSFPLQQLPRACSRSSLRDRNSLRIKIPGIVPVGMHAGNCSLLNLPLKISQGTGAACPCARLSHKASLRRGAGQGALRGAGWWGGDAAAFLLLFRNVVGKTSGKLLEHPNPLLWTSLDIPAPKEGAAPSLVPANHLA